MIKLQKCGLARIAFVCFAIFTSCTATVSNETDDAAKKAYLTERNPVNIMRLEFKDFNHELVTNGKLEAIKKSGLHFTVTEQLVELKVTNGSHVTKGEIIARLNPEKLERVHNNAQTNLLKARLELQDMLIGQGYDLKDSLLVPTEIFEVAKLRSGYTQAFEELQKTKTDLEGALLRAPFAGTIANLNHKVFEQVNAGEVFCTLMDESLFEVSFSVLETEIARVAVNIPIRVVPFYNNQKGYSGKISEINPVVDAFGLVQVKAILNGEPGQMDGMNGKVYIEDITPNQLVVLREAVVLRQNQEVLFNYVNGTAFWTYIKILKENSTSYVVEANSEKGGTLQAGDTIIISGNLNLAHESAVEIE